MSGPKRVQRKRAKGWRMPEGAVYVGRPTKWGNPFRIGGTCANLMGREFKIETAEQAVNAYKNLVLIKLNPGFVFGQDLIMQADLSELKGKDLACWCPLDKPCHADILLELSNK